MVSSDQISLRGGFSQKTYRMDFGSALVCFFFLTAEAPLKITEPPVAPSSPISRGPSAFFRAPRGAKEKFGVPMGSGVLCSFDRVSAEDSNYHLGKRTTFPNIRNTCKKHGQHQIYLQRGFRKKTDRNNLGAALVYFVFLAASGRPGSTEELSASTCLRAPLISSGVSRLVGCSFLRSCEGQKFKA
jgi:hypothetical protein